VLDRLKQQKKIKADASRSSLVGAIQGATIQNITRADIDAYEGLFKTDYGVQRKTSTVDTQDGSLEDMARAV
jgi:hypothetical protein